MTEPHETLKAACNFWKRQGWMKENPTDRVRPAKVGQTGRRRLRRAYTLDEFNRLCAVVQREGHGLTYSVAAFSGLRYGELKRLQKQDCTPTGPQPRWHTRAEVTKIGQPIRLPMTPECAAALAEHWQPLPRPDSPLLSVPMKQTAKRHRQIAGIAPQDERRRWADFHSLRYTFCLWMSRLFPIEVVMKLMRYGTLNLTASIYLDLGIDREGQGEWVLPSLLPPADGGGAGQPAAQPTAPQNERVAG